MRLMSAFTLWLACEYAEENRIGPYAVDLQPVRKGVYDFYLPVLDVRVRRYEANRWDKKSQRFLGAGKARWHPRRPSDDALLLLALAVSGQ